MPAKEQNLFSLSMIPRRPQMDPCRTYMDHLNLEISLFSQSVDSGGRQHLLGAVENGLLGSERGLKFTLLPLWVRHCDLVSQPFPLHLTKGPKTFLILKRPSQVNRGDKHTGGAFRSAMTHICREILTMQMASSVGGGFRIRGPSRLMVHLLRLSEDSLKIISDI